MEQKFSMRSFMKKLMNDELILHLGMPMGYFPGLPVLHSKNNAVCLTVPFYKRRVSRKKVKETETKFLVTETYPVRYMATYALRAVNIPELDKSKPSSVVLTPNDDFLENELTEGKLIAFSDLTYCSGYSKLFEDKKVQISADRPICLFNAKKEEYSSKLEEIYNIYDKAVNTRLYMKKIDGAVESRLINKINDLLESEMNIKPFYSLLDDGDFAAKIAGVGEK